MHLIKDVNVEIFACNYTVSIEFNMFEDLKFN